MTPNFGSNRSSAQGKILLVTSNFPRWAGDNTTPFVWHLAQDLQELDWKVDVLAPHTKGTATCEVIGGVRVERFKYLWPAILETICYQGGALVNLRKKPSNHLKLPALVASEWFAVARRLMDKKYSLLHSHWILPQGFTGVLAARPLGIPHVVTVHGSDVFALRNSLLTTFKRFVLYQADAVTVNSSATEKAVINIAPKVKELHRIPMGISTQLPTTSLLSDDLRKRYRRGQGPLIVFVGRVVKEKGIEDLIRAVALLVPRLPDVSALIVGEGQDRPAFEAVTKSLGLADRVAFCGWIQPEIVPNYLSAGNIFVGPSWAEAQGLTFLEAMLVGIPIVATRVGGIVDIIKHEETGLLVNAHAPNEIADAVEKIVRESSLRQRLSTLGHQLVKREFSRKSSAEAFSQLFTRVIEIKDRVVRKEQG